jgi:transcriptional regulator with XRE-family HTH domain
VTNKPSPTVRRRRLAAELKALRRHSGKSRDEVAAFVGVAPSTITKIENATLLARPADVAMMLDCYGIEPAQREVLLTLARQARQRGWWHTRAVAIPAWFEVYVGLEDEASEILTFHPELIDGRLQTENYIRALIEAEFHVPSETEIRSRIAARLKRQERLRAANPLRLSTVVGEAALHQMIGGPATMREQLHHLLQMMELDSITVQVLPFGAGAHPGLRGGFHLLKFPEPADRDVVYVEYQQGAVYMEQDEDVAACAQVLDMLVARALNPNATRDLITRVAERFSE